MVLIIYISLAGKRCFTLVFRHRRDQAASRVSRTSSVVIPPPPSLLCLISRRSKLRFERTGRRTFIVLSKNRLCRPIRSILFLPIIRSTRSLNLIRRLYRRTPLGRHLSLAGKNLNLAHETRWGPPSFSSELINRSLKFIEIIYAQTRGHRLFSIRSGENL